MRELDLVIKHTAGKENLLVDTLARKHKYSLDPTEAQGFIPQSINPVEDNIEPQDTSIFTNHLSISPVPIQFTMVSCSCINFKHTDCYYNKCPGGDESLGHPLYSLHLDDENDKDYEYYNDIIREEIQLDEDTLTTIPKEIWDTYKFDPHPHIVEQDQLYSYYQISSHADDTSFITNDDNIPAIRTDVSNDA